MAPTFSIYMDLVSQKTRDKNLYEVHKSGEQ